jgi:hypothetical protein
VFTFKHSMSYIRLTASLICFLFERASTMKTNVLWASTFAMALSVVSGCFKIYSWKKTQRKPIVSTRDSQVRARYHALIRNLHLEFVLRRSYTQSTEIQAERARDSRAPRARLKALTSTYAIDDIRTWNWSSFWRDGTEMRGYAGLRSCFKVRGLCAW